MLVALVTGLIVYALMGSFRRHPGSGIGGEFAPIDLVLVWLPLVFFLINPVFAYYFPQDAAGEGSGSEITVLSQVMTSLFQLIYFLFIGFLTVVILPRLMMRDIVDLFGLRRMALRSIIVVSLGATVLSLVVCNFLLGTLSGRFLSERMGELSVQQAVEEMRNADSIAVILVSSLIAFVAAPLVEEVLFRGYFYGVLKRFTSPVFGAVISSGLFAVVHLNLPALVPLWVFALILTWMYELTRCLWVPILVHAMFNAANVMLLLYERWFA